MTAVCIHALVLYKHFFTNTSLPLRRSELSRWRHNWKSAQVVNSQPSVWPHNPATGFWPPSAAVVPAEPFSDGTGTLQCLQKEMATYRHWSVSLWRDPDDISHCRILSPDKTEWRLISATLRGWRRCFVADQLWLMTRIRDEEVYKMQHCCEQMHLILWPHLSQSVHCCAQLLIAPCIGVNPLVSMVSGHPQFLPCVVHKYLDTPHFSAS